MRFRLNLPELEDQPWLPRPMRDGMLDALRFLVEASGVYRAIGPLLADALGRTGAKRLVDLGAGGGGGIRQVQQVLAEALGRPVPVVLTDLYPNVPAFEQLAREAGGLLSYRADSVDAARVPADLPGFRTVFSAFHHFPPPVARRVLADAVAAGAGIGVFEGARKAWWEVVLVWTLFPVVLLLVTPLIRPFRWSRLLLTYVVPLIPLGVIWDGTASLARLYSVAELRRLAVEADPASAYDWQAGRLSAGFGRSVTYLVGVARVQ